MGLSIGFQDLQILLQNPTLMLLLGVLIMLFAYSGRRGSRGPATETPLTVLLVIGIVMVVLGLFGLFR